MITLLELVANVLVGCALDGGLVFDDQTPCRVDIDLMRSSEGDVSWRATVIYRASGFIDAGVED